MNKKSFLLTLGLLLGGVALFSQSEEEKIKELLNAETEVSFVHPFTPKG